MSVFVVDASIAAKWFIDEEHGAAALSVLDEKNELHAPDFLLLEMDSIICKWARRGAINPDEGSQLRENLRRFPIELHPFPSFLDFAFMIASATGQSIYDCLYVALAALLKGKMVTADRRLYESLKIGPFKRNVCWIEEI